MSAILRCFVRDRRDSLDLEKERYIKKGKKKDHQSDVHTNCCKCQCHQVSETDGKKLSKTLPISSVESKKKKHSVSCCDPGSSTSSADGHHHAVTAQYSSLPSPTASVDPSGTPFFMTDDELNELPGKSYMPVSKNDPFYNMSHPKRGKAIIFNFDRWDNTNIPQLGLPPRLGSEKDKKDLAKCLRKLDFQVEEHDNVKNLEMWAVLERIRKEDHTDADCLVVAVMTHGEKNTIFMRDGTQIPINHIWENFEAHKCPSLAAKPKIFIVQACRGKNYDSGTKLRTLIPNNLDILNLSDVTDSSTFSYVIPNAADIIVAFSCPLGHYSWRHPENGSWFIQSICKVFNDNAYKMDLQQLFTTVAREVAVNYESNTTSIESNNKKQVTSTSSTLIRTVIFKPKPQGEYQLPIPLELERTPSKLVTLTSVTTTEETLTTEQEELPELTETQRHIHTEERRAQAHVSVIAGDEIVNEIEEESRSSSDRYLTVNGPIEV